MLATMKRYVTLPIALLFGVGAASVAAVLIFAPEDVRGPVIAGLAPVLTFIALHIAPKDKA